MRHPLAVAALCLLSLACATQQPAGSMEITGVMTAEGVECPAVRGEDGQLYTLSGATNLPSAGTRVRIRGEVAEVSTCMQGTTIRVTSVEPL